MQSTASILGQSVGLAGEVSTAWSRPRIGGVCAAVGRTPLIRLETLSALTGCELYGKAEFLNPGGSVKDRAALGMIKAAEAAGTLESGGVIVEGTAGNTGIGLALLGRARGYRTIAVLPDDVATEKTELLRALGAEVHAVPAVPAYDKGHYTAVAQRLALQTPGGWWANQFDNVANRRAHYETTGPEIWEQTEGRVTAFVAAVGSGGTLAGVAQFLKERNPEVHILCADPYGAAMWSWIKYRHTRYSVGDSVAEGIGQNRVTLNLTDAPIDDAYRVHDRSAVEMLHYLLREEGLFLGLSSAVNVCGAVRLARLRGPGQVIVTVLCDGGGRYLSRLFNSAWLAPRGLLPKARGLEFLQDIED